MAGPQKKLVNSERKDRSIRLWGERGQLALETGHVCVLSATALATEVPSLFAAFRPHSLPQYTRWTEQDFIFLGLARWAAAWQVC